MDINGKTILITGGTSGIGKATAELFAHSGANVAIVGRNMLRGEEIVHSLSDSGNDAIFIQADVSRAEEVKRAVEKTASHFGQLDFAFNNAGLAVGGGMPIQAFTESDFDTVIDTNLKGVWLCMKYEIEQMLAQESGNRAIVNCASINGLGGSRNGALYSASKSGVIALTKSAAQELGPNGIRVNVIAPGAVETPMLNSAIQNAVGDDEEKVAGAKGNFANAIPQKRIGDPQEIAHAVMWLCSSHSMYVTGHTLIVDGGLTAYAR
ncbi:MAG: glucose 1-dehydrogenase [Chloroflexota bacterium]